jgi:hypothetical protein
MTEIAEFDYEELIKEIKELKPTNCVHLGMMVGSILHHKDEGPQVYDTDKIIKMLDIMCELDLEIKMIRSIKMDEDINA